MDMSLVTEDVLFESVAQIPIELGWVTHRLEYSESINGGL